MSNIIQILMFEEGYKTSPYRDTLGYPTIGCGIKLGPKGAGLDNYSFCLPRQVGLLWLQLLLDVQEQAMNRDPAIQAALRQCNPPRSDVLCSMAFQLGVDGLSAFNDTLLRVAAREFNAAADAMQDSLWARQTPARAQRHADVMRSGTYGQYREVA